MRIKKTPDQNEYIRVDNLWVRNFAKLVPKARDINNVVSASDSQILLDNEIANRARREINISDEGFTADRIVIVSDGFDFEKRKELLAAVPKRWAVFMVNGALAKWDRFWQRPVNFYIVNNPYNNCCNYLPTKTQYFPACAASLRTSSVFIRKYPGSLYFYNPTPSVAFGFEDNPDYFIDDYRNPICAAIGLAYRFKVKKLALLCCDDSFADEREAAIHLQNGLWSYEAQILAQRLIDANLYWLTHQENEKVEVVNYSSGIELENARYISNEQEFTEFLTG